MRQLVALLVLLSVSAVAMADSKLSGRVTDQSEQPIGGTTVIITAPDGAETRVVTDPTGGYVATVPAGGRYTVVFTFGKMRIAGQVDVPADGAATLDGKLEMTGEIIEVRENRPLQYAKPKFDPLVIPPYTDRVALGDYWVKAWLLLYVDDHGVVTRVKFLKRPGYDLDEIAVKHAFGLTFDPARNAHGVPVASYIVWPLEWPSMGWLQSRSLLMNRLPSFRTMVQGPHGLVFDTLPRCAGSSPVNLSSIHPVLRDCSVPDLSRADASEPWLTRDSKLPAPIVGDAPVIDPAQHHKDLVAAAKRNRTYAFAALGATGAMAVGLVVSYLQFKNYSERVDASVGTTELMPDLASDRRRKHDWELRMIGFTAATIVSGMGATYFWSRSAAFTLEARASGGALSYSGQF
jgi:hypothetical protein